MWITLLNKDQDNNVKNIIILRKEFFNFKQNILLHFSVAGKNVFNILEEK